LNSRRAINPRWFSRPVHSAALPPLRNEAHIKQLCLKSQVLFEIILYLRFL